MQTEVLVGTEFNPTIAEQRLTLPVRHGWQQQLMVQFLRRHYVVFNTDQGSVPFGLLYYRDTVVKSVWMVVAELLLGLAEYFIFYNSERFHQALSYKTPNEVYQTGIGGGVTIVEHFSDKRVSSKVEVGQRQSAVTESICS